MKVKNAADQAQSRRVRRAEQRQGDSVKNPHHEHHEQLPAQKRGQRRVAFARERQKRLAPTRRREGGYGLAPAAAVAQQIKQRQRRDENKAQNGENRVRAAPENESRGLRRPRRGLRVGLPEYLAGGGERIDLPRFDAGGEIGARGGERFE